MTTQTRTPRGREIIFQATSNLCFQEATRGSAAAEISHMCLTAGAGLAPVTSGQRTSSGRENAEKRVWRADSPVRWALWLMIGQHG